MLWSADATGVDPANVKAKLSEEFYAGYPRPPEKHEGYERAEQALAKAAGVLQQLAKSGVVGEGPFKVYVGGSTYEEQPDEDAFDHVSMAITTRL